MTNINEYALVSGHPRDAKKRSPFLELAAYEKFLREIAQIQINIGNAKKKLKNTYLKEEVTIFHD